MFAQLRGNNNVRLSDVREIIIEGGFNIIRGEK
jgi:hypothetical protein